MTSHPARGGLVRRLGDRRRSAVLLAAAAALCVLTSGCALRASAGRSGQPPNVAKMPHSTLGALLFAPPQASTSVALDQPVLVQTPYSDARLQAVTVTDADGVVLHGSLSQRTFALAGGLRPDSHYTVTATVALPQDGASPGAVAQQTQVVTFSTVTTPQILSVTPTALAPAQPAVVMLDTPASDVQVQGPARAQLNPGGMSVSLYPQGYQPGVAYPVTVTLTSLAGTAGLGHGIRLVALGGPKLSGSPSQGATNLGVGIPLVVTVSKPPADPAAFAARLSVESDVTPTVATPPIGALPGLAGSLPGGVCQAYAPAPQAGGTIPTAAKWISSTRLQLTPKTPDGYWPPDATVRVTGTVDGLAATDGSQFTGGYASSFQTADKRVIDVDLSSQTLTACRNGVQANQFLVSTGQQGKETARGTFTIYERILSAEMKGGGVGPSAPGYYDVKNVPYTQYFNGGDALHGAWWHNNFGHPMSHGCVNVSTPTHNASWPNAAADAEYLWNFDNVGDPVIVHGTTP